MYKRYKISVVVPVYTEEENIQPFYHELCQVTDGKNYDIEMIFVNDGSTDNTLERLKMLANQDDRVSVINFSRNFGSYAAIEAGFKYAEGDATMVISVDLQDPPSLINEFVSKWRQGYDIVWGTRESRQDPFLKTLYASIFYWLIKKFIFPKFPKKGMDVGLFDKRIIQLYIETEDRHSIPFFTIYAMGFCQAEIPYIRKKRVAGESGWPFWKRIKCAIDIFVNFSYIPIRLSIAIGILFEIIAFLFAFVLIIVKLSTHIPAPGWTSLAVLVLFLGGLQLHFLGVIAEYIWRINDSVKQKPNYYIMELIQGAKRAGSCEVFATTGGNEE